MFGVKRIRKDARSGNPLITVSNIQTHCDSRVKGEQILDSNSPSNWNMACENEIAARERSRRCVPEIKELADPVFQEALQTL